MSGEDTLRCWLYLLHWTTTRPFAPRPRTSAPRSPEPPGIRTSVSRSRCRSRATSRSNCGPDIPSVLPTCASSRRWRAARARDAGTLRGADGRPGRAPPRRLCPARQRSGAARRRSHGAVSNHPRTDPTMTRATRALPVSVSLFRRRAACPYRQATGRLGGVVRRTGRGSAKRELRAVRQPRARNRTAQPSSPGSGEHGQKGTPAVWERTSRQRTRRKRPRRPDGASMVPSSTAWQYVVRSDM